MVIAVTSLFNTLNANPTKWSNTLKQFLGNLPTNCLNVFDHFVGLAFKALLKRPPGVVTFHQKIL